MVANWAPRLLAALAIFAWVPSGAAQSLLLGVTSTTENSGLLGHLLPRFTQATGIEVRALVHGTGAILKLAETGDIDAALVHDRAAEDRFMAAGFGEHRRDVMKSRFLFVGPAHDPAGIRGLENPVAVMRRIALARAPFLSRGDDSGTPAAELRLWRDAGLAPQDDNPAWYRETGSGMGATLNTGAALGAYMLADRPTWESFGNRAGLEALAAGADPRFANPYGVIVVDPVRHAHVAIDAARAFSAWLTGAAGQAAIAAFEIGGERMFVPTAILRGEGG